MAMSVSDPRVLLDAMSTMLGEYGDIRGPADVLAVISLMKDAEKLLSRYTFLNILRATIEVASGNIVALETVNQFVKDGGCTILNKWLADAKGLENLPLLLDVLEILEAMPVTIEALKKGNIGKLVKQLTKSEEKDVKELANSLLDKWMVLVKGKPKKSKKSEEQTDGTDSNTSGKNTKRDKEDSNTSGSPTMKRSRDNSTSGKSGQPPEKKTKSLAEAKSSVTSVAKPPPKTKFIAALPKPVVMESSGFMNALIQQSASVTTAKKKKKEKVAPPPSPTPKSSYSGPLEEILQNQTQTHRQEDEKDKSSKEKEKGKDEEKEEEQEKEKDDSQEKSLEGDAEGTGATSATEESQSTPESEKTTSDQPSTESSVDTSSSESCVKQVTVPEEQEKSDSTDAVEPMETEKVDSEVKNEDEKEKEKEVPKKKKKSITWAEDEKLLVYHYYEPDDEERVQHVVNFHDAQQKEAIRERQRVEQAKRLSEDKMMEKLPWYRPRPWHISELMERGDKSEEKLLQKDRESKILAHLFFSKSSLPISPDEPDPEMNPGSTSSQPLVIPHDEKGTIYPPSKGAAVIQSTEPTPDPSVSLPPALAALLANTNKGPGNSTSGVAGSGNNPTISNVDVQALLKKLMASQGQEGLQDPAVQKELGGLRFPSPLMSQNLRMPGRGPGDQGPRGMAPEPPRRGLPDYRPRGLLRPPGPPDHPRFPGQHLGGPLRGRFHPPGGPRLRHPMPGQRMPGPPMGRGGMPNRFPGPEGKRNSGDEFYNDQYNFNEGDNPDGLGRGLPPRGRGTRGRGRGRPTCRHFTSPRGCLRGNTCTFLHPGVNGPPG